MSAGRFEERANSPFLRAGMAVRRAASLTLAVVPGMAGGFRLYPEDREAEDQQDQEDHDEDIEQKAGDLG